MKKLLLTGLLLLGALTMRAAAAPAHTSFDFTQAGRHVTVWYFVPPGATPQTPVVIVMHGVGRNGEDYLADWLPLAHERKFLLVVPEFSKKEFPGVEGYNYGNTVDPAGHALPREQWSFNMIEPIFDAVRGRTGNRTERYRLFGHSAGAQFVQRFIYFVPSARLESVVSANAGWYMLPDLSIAFPYGLKNTPVTAADLRHALTLPVTVLLGTADVDPEAKSLRHTPEADAQGLYRFARGKFFMARAEEAARKFQLPFVWRMVTAPDIAHSDKDMAPFAVRELFSQPTQ
jgi:poly(3-hydroxybutyrate) depolymerase